MSRFAKLFAANAIAAAGLCSSAVALSSSSAAEPAIPPALPGIPGLNMIQQFATNPASMGAVLQTAATALNGASQMVGAPATLPVSPIEGAPGTAPLAPLTPATAPAAPTPSTALPNANWLRTNSMLNAPNVTGQAYDERFSPTGYIGPSHQMDTGMVGGYGHFGLAGGRASR